MAPMSVENMSAEEFNRFIDSFDVIMSDCDGVIWIPNENDEKARRKSGDFFESMKKLGKRTYYVSNNSMRSMTDYEQRFESCGIRNGLEGLITPPEAIIDYLKSVKFDKKVFCISNNLSIKALEKHGFQCKHGPMVGDDDFSQYYRYGIDDPEIGAVVLDVDFNLNYAKLVMAATYLKRPDVHFISGPTDKFVAIAKDINILGIGQFCDILGEHTNRKPVVLGKPGREFGQYLMKRAAIVDPKRVLFIGDMFEQDIGQGKECGFQTLLVLSTHNEAEMAQQQRFIPDFYTTSLGAILPFIFSRL